MKSALARARERCGDDARNISAQLAQLAQNASTFRGAGVAFELFNLGPNATLVTNNTREFSRIEGLKLEDWL